MDEALRWSIGGAAALAAWLIPRRVAGARLAAKPAMALDILPVLVAGALLLIGTGRPMFSGIVLLALGGGFALADHSKRQALREPVVFSDMSELEHVFTHPHLYLPFAGPAVVIGGALTAIGLGIAVLIFSPALWQPQLPFTTFALLVTFGAGWLLCREPLLGIAAARLRRFQPTGEPLADAARLGPFAVLFVYGIIARAERAERRAPLSPVTASAAEPERGDAGRTGAVRIILRRAPGIVTGAPTSVGGLRRLRSSRAAPMVGSKFRLGAPTRCAPNLRR